ncbi:hypothetical protein DWY73_03695 [Bacteroides fragilis]|nr:hypothetical protein DWY73_03695 [Bacteroides fragilis]RHM62308.1 hypothetical protein DWZ57_10780 [Bacteroides fragilis]
MEDKWPQNSIFRQDRHLVINNIHPERRKMEDRKSFFGFFFKFSGKFFIFKLIIVLFACFNKKRQTPAE